MTAALMTTRLEATRIDRRTRRSTAVSLGVHALLLALLSFAPRLGGEHEAITEITWLEPEPPAPAPAPAPEPVRTKAETPKPKPVEQRFERKREVAEVAPEPQTPRLDDQLAKRLTALKPKPAPASAPIRAAAPAVALPKAAMPASVATPSPAGAPVALRRETPSAPALDLKRERKDTPPPALARVDRPVPTSAAPEAATGSGATRSLAGTTLAGPAADRPVSHYELPDYPDWAKREGVEATVSLQFIVLPDGRIKDGVLIQKTSGYEDFDRAAKAALLAWRFEPLSGGKRVQQWGTITFNFRLRDGR